MTDKAAYYAIQATRGVFDLVTRYSTKMSEDQWLTRVVYLETVAGVPGMVGAMIRHLQSLRLMRRDHGWIHTLLEEVRCCPLDFFTGSSTRENNDVHPAWASLVRRCYATRLAGMGTCLRHVSIVYHHDQQASWGDQRRETRDMHALS